MKDGIMKTNLIIFVTGSLLAMAVVSCQSSADKNNTSGYSFQKRNLSTREDLSGRQPSGPMGGKREPGQGGGMADNQAPELTDSMELLLKIDSLVNSPDPSLVITNEQGQKMVPILKDWKISLENESDFVSEKYIDELNALMSIAQVDSKLEIGPPAGDNGRPQGPPPGAGTPSGRPEMGPPSELDLLDNILERLS